MGARPLPPPEPDPTNEKVRPTNTVKAGIRQPFLAKILSIADAPALRMHLNAVMKTRWLRITGIAVAVLLVILLALPFLIDVNSFRPKIESELMNVLGRPVTVTVASRIVDFALIPFRNCSVKVLLKLTWARRGALARPSVPMLAELGHEVIVAHARNVRLIRENRKKATRPEKKPVTYKNQAEPA